jgi:hypothetical protein
MPASSPPIGTTTVMNVAIRMPRERRSGSFGSASRRGKSAIGLATGSGVISTSGIWSSASDCKSAPGRSTSFMDPRCQSTIKFAAAARRLLVMALGG